MLGINYLSHCFLVYLGLSPEIHYDRKYCGYEIINVYTSSFDYLNF